MKSCVWKSNIETFIANIIVGIRAKIKIPDELTTVTSAPKSYRKCEIIANVNGIEITHTHTQADRADEQTTNVKSVRANDRQESKKNGS